MLDRRQFLVWLGGGALAATQGQRQGHAGGAGQRVDTSGDSRAASIGRGITLFLCGDLMTGRGIDQILPHPGGPQLYEPYMRDARDYVALAERVSGAVARPVPYDYVWGDAITELARMGPDLCIVNLETSITAHDGFQPKGINYRMHPANVAVLTVAGIDCCALANNHVLDWEAQGLADTLEALAGAGIHAAGAGRNLAEAQAPAILPVSGKGRVLVFAFAEQYSGVAPDWAATASRPGIDLLPGLSAATVDGIAARVREVKRAGDIAVASIHWGGNWGYEITPAQRRFAHGLIDRASIDLVHGHSSHHAKGIEVYRDRAIIYGCGDFLNDYEGISGHQEFRAELGLMYFPTLDPATGRLLQFALTPTRIRKLRVQHAAPAETAWLTGMLNREGMPLGTRVAAQEAGGLRVHWDGR